MSRDILPNRRQSETEEFDFSGVSVSMTLGHYDDGRVGEVFLNTRKAGTPVDIACRDIAVLMSLLLQYGCSAKIMRNALTCDAAGRPEGIAGLAAGILCERGCDGTPQPHHS